MEEAWCHLGQTRVQAGGRNNRETGVDDNGEDSVSPVRGQDEDQSVGAACPK